MKKTIISLYESVIKQSKISDRPYQRDFLTDSIYLTPIKPIVLGAGTSSGKTVIAILKLILFYLIPSNKTKKSLVIPAFQEILRDNFMEQLREIESNYGKLPFTYIEIKGKNSDEQIKEAIKNGINVIICLPATINNNSSLLRNKIEWLYFDEAQYFYLQKMCRNLVSIINPKYQMLMTGSVAKYNARREDFIIKYVPVSELFKLGYISNPKVELIQSSYNFKDADYVSLWGNLKDTKTNDTNQNTKALLSVAKGMLLTLRNPFMDVTTNSKPIKKMLRVFGEIDKTIMICNSIPQAKCFYSILNEELKGDVMISHSKTEKEDWDNFEKFKTNDIKLLIVVNQGRIGFSMRELFNVVDFSMSKDFEMIQQIFGRLLRASDLQPNKTKIYYKVSTVDLAKWYEYTMICVMCLMHMEWYSTYTGDKKQFKFPKRIIQQLANTSSKSKSKSKSKSNGFNIPEEFPLDLNFVKYINQNMKSDFATYAWWKLDDVMKEEFSNRNFWTESKIIQEAKQYKTKKEFGEKSRSAYCAAHNLGIIDKVCSHMIAYKNDYSENDIINISKKCKTRKEFFGIKGVRHAVSKFNMMDKLPPHIKTKPLNFKSVLIEAKKYNTKSEFQKGRKTAYRWAEENGVMDKICSHMSTSTHLKWTKETIATEAKRYKYRTDFRSGTPSAYYKAIKLNILDEVCNHMANKIRNKR